MSTYRDATGKEWPIAFDAFVLDDLRSDLNIDLADLTAGGYEKIQSDVVSLVKVLAKLCGQPMREFAKAATGPAIESGRAAILDAAADFFPASDWSAIQSNLTKRKESQAATIDLEAAGPLLDAIGKMPPDMRQGAMDELRKAMRTAGATATDLDGLQDEISATGQDAIQSNSVTVSAENVESSPGD